MWLLHNNILHNLNFSYHISYYLRLNLYINIKLPYPFNLNLMHLIPDKNHIQLMYIFYHISIHFLQHFYSLFNISNTNKFLDLHVK